MDHDALSVWLRRSSVALCLATLLSGQAMAQTCSELVESFNKTLEQGRAMAAAQIADQASADPGCTLYQIPMRRRLSANLLNEVQGLMARGRPPEEYEALLAMSERSQVLWQASATMGEVYFGARRFSDSAMAFDRAIEVVKNEVATPIAPSPAEIESLLDRAAQARLLAANQTPPANKTDEFVKTASNTAGNLGGVYSPLVRGIVPRAVPVSITFEYRSAVLTPVGQQAARELLRAIQEQLPEKIRVIGHTDPRGTPDYNIKLSKARAETVANFLRGNGVKAQIVADGVGSAEPMKLGASTGLSEDDINALNRRVEWRRD